MKDFDRWNKTKKKISSKQHFPVKLGDVHWCSLGLNIGFEQDGDNENFQRPVIILKKFSSSFVLVAPITTRNHVGDWYLDINILNQRRLVILNQIKPVDTKRLNFSFCEISNKERLKILNFYIELIKE